MKRIDVTQVRHYNIEELKDYIYARMKYGLYDDYSSRNTSTFSSSSFDENDSSTSTVIHTVERNDIYERVYQDIQKSYIDSNRHLRDVIRHFTKLYKNGKYNTKSKCA